MVVCVILSFIFAIFIDKRRKFFWSFFYIVQFTVSLLSYEVPLSPLLNVVLKSIKDTIEINFWSIENSLVYKHGGLLLTFSLPIMYTTGFTSVALSFFRRPG